MNDDKIVSIITLTSHTMPFRPVSEPPGVGKYGGTPHPTWPVPKTTLRLVDPRDVEREHAAPGPPLSLAVGRRSIVQRVKARVRR